MDKLLKEEIVHALFRFRKVGMILPQRSDLNMTELLVMRRIEEMSTLVDNSINLSEIHCNLHITKSAISQMLGSLEKKGYIERSIDTTDRRKVLVNLTQTGIEIMQETKESVNNHLGEIVSRLGNENTEQLISLLERVSDISEELKSEI